MLHKAKNSATHQQLFIQFRTRWPYYFASLIVFLISVYGYSFLRTVHVSATNTSYVTSDLNDDSAVSIKDLSMLLTYWGTADAAADINQDGTVDLPDLSTLLSDWTGPLAFDDEFNGSAGTQPSSSEWTPVNNAPFSTTQDQCYENSTNNLIEDGAGNLKIIALSAPGTNCGGTTENYTSGRLQTINTFNQKYGTVSMRAKLPTAKGMFPAFWMVGTNTATLHDPCDGEIDIMETIGSDTGSKWSDGTIHGPYNAGNCPTTYYSHSGQWTDTQDLSANFHTYTVTWSPQTITFKNDGSVYYTITKSALPNSEAWVFDTDPEYLILNLAIGGSWAGNPDANTAFPQMMYVDFVRVTAK